MASLIFAPDFMGWETRTYPPPAFRLRADRYYRRGVDKSPKSASVIRSKETFSIITLNQ